jgi:hypothetical protein
MHKLALTLAFAVATLTGAAARADQLLVTTPLVVGSLSSVSNFQISGPGTVTVSLTDLGWTDRLASLTFAATNASGVVASMTGPGQISFNVSSPGMYSTVVGAVASTAGFLDLGWYSMTVNFAPAAAVPLPASALLLLSCLLLLGVALRTRPRSQLPAHA